MMHVQDHAAARRAGLVDELRRSGHLHDPAVATAVAEVPRHLFVPGVDLDTAYRDEAVLTKSLDGRIVSSATEPSAVVALLEQLKTRPGHRVLEVGAGTGYNAALLAHLVGADGRVVTIDLDDDLVADAREHLRLAGLGGVKVVCRDGARGFAPGVPYDRMIVTASTATVPSAWPEQLADDGVLLVPVARGGFQYAVAFQRVGIDRLMARSVRPCRYMPFRGELSGIDQRVLVPGHPGVFVEPASADAAQVAAIDAALATAPLVLPTGVRCGVDAVAARFAAWLGAVEPKATRLGALALSVDAAADCPVPRLVERVAEAGGWVRIETPCLIGQGALAALAWADANADELVVHVFGDDAVLGARLVDEVRRWDGAGRPGVEALAFELARHSDGWHLHVSVRP